MTLQQLFTFWCYDIVCGEKPVPLSGSLSSLRMYPILTDSVDDNYYVH